MTLRKFPIFTAIAVLFVGLKFGPKIKEWLNKTAPSVGKMLE